MRLDLREPVRALIRDVSFSAVAVSLLAVTLGTITAVYAIVHAIVLRPFPFAEQDRLAVIWQRDLRRELPVIEVAYGEMVDWRQRTRSFEDLAVMGSVNWSLTLLGTTEPQSVQMAAVSASFFPVVGTLPAIGRVFSAADEQGSLPRRIVISHGLWERRFGRDPAIAGRVLPTKLAADGPVVPLEVTGVMPAAFDFPRGADVWVPAAPLVRGGGIAWNNDAEGAIRTLRVFYALGRVHDGVSHESATWDLSRVMRTTDTGGGPEPPSEVVVTPVARYLLGPAAPVLMTLFGGALLMLVIACANVAGLQVSRSARRERIHAIRIALGAANRHIVWETIVESVVVSAVALVGAALVAMITARALLLAAPASVPRLDTVAVLDAPVLLVGGIAAFVTIILCGLWPAFVAGRLDAVSVLAHGAAVAADPRGRRVQRVVVVAQVAIALVLLTGAALFLRTLDGLSRTVLGFNPNHLLAVSVTPETSDLSRRNAFFDALLTRIESLRGVSAAGAVYLRPLSGPIGFDSQPFHPGQIPQDPRTWGLNPHTNLEVVTPGYFRTMGIRLVRGRLFTERDTGTSPGVVIVSESAARRLWPRREAIGQRLRDPAYLQQKAEPPLQWQSVVGIVEDVRYRGLNDVRLDLYLPATQSTNHVQQVMVRTREAPAEVAAAVRAIARALDPAASVSEATIMSEVVEAESAPWRFLMRVFVAFAVLGATLAAIGLTAVVTFAVATRRRELAIRAALGAGPGQLRTVVVREALWLIAVGSGLGLLGALALGRGAASLLIGVAPHDARALGVAVCLTVAVGLVASWLPARRAAEANPIEALRAE